MKRIKKISRFPPYNLGTFFMISFAYDYKIGNILLDYKKCPQISRKLPGFVQFEAFLMSAPPNP